jgi:hypothetical protein
VASPPAHAEETRSYAWQIAVADGSSLAALVAATMAGHPEAGAALGGVGFVGAAPIIHGAHARPGAAVGSLALRVGLPLLGGFIGYWVTGKCTPHDRPFEYPDESCDWSDLGRAIDAGLGVAVGVLAASALDMAFLAREPVPARRDEHAAPRLHLAPTATAVRGGAVGGVAGVF